MAGLDRDEIAKLEALYSSNPEGRIFTHLAEAYRRAGETARALDLVERGLERHPHYSSAHVVRGRILLDKGEWTAAEEAFDAVLKLDPENRVALRSLAEIAANSGRVAEAAEYYRELLLLDPNDEAAAEAIGAVLDTPVEEVEDPVDLAAAGEEFIDLDTDTLGVADPVDVADPVGPEDVVEPIDVADLVDVADPFEIDEVGAAGLEPADVADDFGFAMVDLDALSLEDATEAPIEGELAPDAVEGGEEPAIEALDLEVSGAGEEGDEDLGFEPLSLEGLEWNEVGEDEPTESAAEPSPGEPPLIDLDAEALHDSIPMIDLDDLAPEEPVSVVDLDIDDDPLAEWQEEGGTEEPGIGEEAPGDEVIDHPEPIELTAGMVVEEAAVAEPEGVEWHADEAPDAVPPEEPAAEMEVEEASEVFDPLEPIELTADMVVGEIDAVPDPYDDPLAGLPLIEEPEPIVEDAAPLPEDLEPIAEDPAPLAEEPVLAAGPEAFEIDVDSFDDDDDDYGSISLVTETMGDLYASQGLLTQAAQVYRELLEERPGDAGLLDKLEGVERAIRGGGARIAVEASEEEVLQEAPVEGAADPGTDSWGGLEVEAAEDDESLAAPVRSAGTGRTIGAYLEALLSWGALAVEGADPGDDAGPAGAAGPDADDEPILLDASMEVVEEVAVANGASAAEEAILLDESMIVAEGEAAGEGREAAEMDDEDLEVFRKWLRNLKR